MQTRSCLEGLDRWGFTGIYRQAKGIDQEELSFCLLLREPGGALVSSAAALTSPVEALGAWLGSFGALRLRRMQQRYFRDFCQNAAYLGPICFLPKKGRLLIWLVSLGDALIPGPSPPDRRGHLSPQPLGAVITASSLMRPSQESSAIHQHKSAARICVSPPRWPSLSLPTPPTPPGYRRAPGSRPLSHAANSHGLSVFHTVLCTFPRHSIGWSTLSFPNCTHTSVPSVSLHCVHYAAALHIQMIFDA